MKRSLMKRKTILWRRLLIGITLIWLGAAVTLDTYGRRATAAETWDAIVVAGCRVMPDGQPSHALEARTRKAVDLWRQGLAPVIVFTGGVGDTPPAESVAASNLALTLGVPTTALVLESTSASTEENARYASGILGGGRIIVVSDAYHVFRCERVFARYFDEVRGAGALSPIWPRTRGAFREVAAVGYYAVKGRL